MGNWIAGTRLGKAKYACGRGIFVGVPGMVMVATTLIKAARVGVGRCDVYERVGVGAGPNIYDHAGFDRKVRPRARSVTGGRNAPSSFAPLVPSS